MPAAERMTVTIPIGMVETLRQTVWTGRFASTGEVAREALRDWMHSHGVEPRDLEALRAAIRDWLDSGPGIPADEMFAELHDRYAGKS